MGALWFFVASLDPAARPAFMLFGVVTAGVSLANLVMLGDWRRKRGSD